MLFSIRHTSPVVCIFLDSAHITRGFTSCHTRCQLLLVDAILFAILVAGEKGGRAKGGDCANLIQLRWRGDGGEMAGRWRGDGANLGQLRMGGNGRRMGGDCANLIQLRGRVKGGGGGGGGVCMGLGVESAPPAAVSRVCSACSRHEAGSSFIVKELLLFWIVCTLDVYAIGIEPKSSGLQVASHA